MCLLYRHWSSVWLVQWIGYVSVVHSNQLKADWVLCMLVTKENVADINEQWHVVRMSHIPGRGASTPHSIRPGTHGEYSTHKKSLHQIIHSQSLITNNPFCKMYQSIKPF